MKSFVLCLMSFVLAIVVSAQEQQRRSGLFGGSRSRRSAAATRSTAAEPSPSVSTPEADSAAGSGGRSIEFNAAPVDMVFTVYQDLVGKTVLKDPQTPQATITLQPKKGQVLSDEDKIEAIETVLEMNGIHMEPYGEKFVRALPRKDVRKDGIPLIMDPEAPLRESTRVVSLMVQLKCISVEDGQKTLDNFKSATGIIIGLERSNSLLITDTEQNINRMREIVKAIDISSPVQEDVYVRPIVNLSASKVQEVLQKIVEDSMKAQEKDGKTLQGNNAQMAPTARPLLGGLRRPGQQQPSAPANNESLVMAVSDADRGMIRGRVLILAEEEHSNRLIIITRPENMKLFDRIIEQIDIEKIPDVQVKVYRLKYAEAEDVSDMINDLIGNSASSKDSKGAQTQNKAGGGANLTRGSQTAQRKPANQRTGESKAGELNKDNVTVLADKRINGLVVMARTEDIPTIEQIIESMDIKLSQVLIETVIIEVTLGDGLETGMDWVQKGRQGQVVPTQHQNALGQDLFYTKRTTSYTDANGTRSSTSFLSDMVPAGYSSSSTTTKDGTTVSILDEASDVAAMFSKNVVDRSGFMNNWRGATSVGLAGGANSGSAAYGIASGIASNAFGKAFNFIFDSDELGLSAILQATKSDSRSKYVASPIVMTLDNKEAVINATRMKYLLKGFTSSGNSYSTIAVPDYEQKELGIELKITPKINPNGTVMLTVEEKYTQVGADQTIQYASSNGGGTGGGALQPVNVPTTITREMSADVLLENNQTVVFGGLTETQTSESESGIPLLKDIPFIGKWLFGSVKQSEDRVELLVFMTPYVLDDAQAAQVEALRRKKTMSDPRPWEDHGWSLSPLADPVSKREQMRRIKDEWRKQDEERRTKIAIEKAKVDRVKQLEKMSKDEREMWLKMHKEELDAEAQDELEEKMLDKDSQEELKKLAAQIRKEKLGAAEKTLKAADEEAAAENERGKLDAAKKAKEEVK